MGSFFALWIVPARAQFTANIQGLIQDPSGAGVAKAQVFLVNTATGVQKTTTSDASGNYRFISLAPGSYKISVEASGFAKTEADICLLTEQNLNLPITLKVGSATESVVVTTQAPSLTRQTVALKSPLKMKASRNCPSWAAISSRL